MSDDKKYFGKPEDVDPDRARRFLWEPSDLVVDSSNAKGDRFKFNPDDDGDQSTD